MVEELVVPMRVRVRPEAGSVRVVWVLAMGLKRLATLLWMLLSMLADLMNLCATLVLINLISAQSHQTPIFWIFAANSKCFKEVEIILFLCFT